MFDHYLRGVKDRVLAPVSRLMGARVSPDAITWTALMTGLLCAAEASRGAWGGALWWWLVNRVLDGLDGTHAREQGRATPFGGYLDIVIDFVVYAAVPLALVRATPVHELAVAGAWLLAAFYVNAASWMYLAAILEQRRAGAVLHGERTTITMPAGAIAGTETIVLYGALFVLPSMQVMLFWTMAALAGVNVVWRFAWANAHLRSAAPAS